MQLLTYKDRLVAITGIVCILTLPIVSHPSMHTIRIACRGTNHAGAKAKGLKQLLESEEFGGVSLPVQDGLQHLPDGRMGPVLAKDVRGIDAAW